jgi:predicted ABC-type ATPase
MDITIRDIAEMDFEQVVNLFQEFETTLASKTYKNTILNAKNQGYSVTLLFFWLQNIELAKERIKVL